jgi:putative transposase
VVAQKGWRVALETMPDLVHLVVEVNPQRRIRRLVDATKARSSRLLTHVSWPPSAGVRAG